ncbi:hypothetical protein BGW38_002272 [Lunasporangiospora selenospora]|uniref:Ferritin-like domain-containing protein n=1 Tax=Lunasporangiospora selenospora TaxID=979761 RepID=A0A9P6KD07_9FUNG|nr:hypothetical protein BGW38_002272 [Lunasporangiospora selenospora]
MLLMNIALAVTSVLVAVSAVPAPGEMTTENPTRTAIVANTTTSRPTRKPSPTSSPNATTILNYALAFEQLQADFYKQGLERFNATDFEAAGFNSTVRDQFAHIGNQTEDHVEAITSAIDQMNGMPFPGCNYTFPWNNVSDFAALAREIETVGISAYLGAAGGLSGAKPNNVTTLAASILSVKGRNAGYLNTLMNQTAAPYSFDTPLGAREVLSLGSTFISNCTVQIGLQPFPQLMVNMSSDGTRNLTLSYEGDNNRTANNTWCQFLYGNKVNVTSQANCTSLPEDVNGYVYIAVTNSSKPISAMSNNTQIIAGPALVFFDVPLANSTNSTEPSPTSTLQPSPTSETTVITTLTTESITVPVPTQSPQN